MKHIRNRLLFALAIVWIGIIAVFIGEGWTPFFVQLGKEPLDLDTMTIEDVTKGRAVKGECLVVYDLIGYEYTENEDSGTTKNNNYYWLVDCGENDVMLVKTSAYGDLSDNMEAMADAYWDAENWDDYAANFPGSATLDGVFIKSDSDMVNYYNEWISDMSSAADSWKTVQLAPYTLDCTSTFGARMLLFRIGLGMAAVTIAVGVIVIVSITKGAKKGPVAQYAGVPAGSYGSMNGGSYDMYNSNPAQQNTAYGQSGAYTQQQGNSAYGQTGTYIQQQGNTAYGQTGTYTQQQGNSAYGQSGTYTQQQSNSAYGQSGTYTQQQGNSAYGQSGTYTQQQSNSAYGQSGTYTQQQGGTLSLSKDNAPQQSVNYGSSVSGGINYGSTMQSTPQYEVAYDPNAGSSNTSNQ